MSSRHGHGHGYSKEREYDRRSEYGREGRDKRDDRGAHHHHRSSRDADGDRIRDYDRSSRPKAEHHSRSRDARESRSPRRERGTQYHSGNTPSKGSTPGPKGNSMLAELLRTAKAKQHQEQAGGSAPVSGSGSDGEGPEAGEILPQPPLQPQPHGGGGAPSGPKRRYHSPIVWNLDGPSGAATTTTRTTDGGDDGDVGRPPLPKRPKSAAGSAVDRAAEELAAFRRQQAEAAALGYDPEGPPAMKASPSASESEEGDVRSRSAPGWATRGSGSEEPGADGQEGEGAERAQGRSDPMDEDEEEQQLNGRPRGGSRWHDTEAEPAPRGRSGGPGGMSGGEEGQEERGRGASPSPRRATSVAGGETASGRNGGGGPGRASSSPRGGAGGEGREDGRDGGEDIAGSGEGEETLISQQIASLAECRSVDEYERLNRVSEGTFGVVFRARCKRTGRICALKKIKMERERDGFPVTSIREINILLNLHHPNIVNVSEVVMGGHLNQIYMVMEFMDHDLKSLMDDKSQMTRPFSVAEVKCLMLQLLSGIDYLHENWVIHRDLKTSNILYNNRGELKICDFGLARQFGSPLRPYTQPVVTLWYRPPELLLGEQLYSTAVDMWSIGCIMAELLTGKPLFDGQGEIEQLDKICSVLGTPNEDVWPGLKQLPNWGKIVLRPQPSQLRQRFTSSFGSGATLTEAGFDLLSRLLAYDPKQRIPAGKAREHRWFSESPYPQRRELMPTFRSNKDGNRPVRQAAVGGGSPQMQLLAALKAR